MDPVFRAVCDIRPLQNCQEVNARLAQAGANFTIEELAVTWPETVPRCAFISELQGVISGVIFFQDQMEGVALDGVAIGDGFEAVQARFPEARHLRRQDRADGTSCDVYLLEPSATVQREITVEDGRVNQQFFKVGGDDQTKLRLFEEARQLPPFADVWVARTHGFLQTGAVSDQLRDWAASYANDFHGSDWTKLADWLIEASTPLERHAFVLAYNWDHGVPPLVWIAHQPDTYLATLAEMFWLAEPGYFEEHRRHPEGPVDTDVFDLLWDIRDIVRTGQGAPGLAFAPGASAATYASDDPQSFFVPVFCRPIPGKPFVPIDDAWPIPIN